MSNILRPFGSLREDRRSEGEKEEREW